MFTRSPHHYENHQNALFLELTDVYSSRWIMHRERQLIKACSTRRRLPICKEMRIYSGIICRWIVYARALARRSASAQTAGSESGAQRDRWDGGDVCVGAFHSLFAPRICIQSGKLRGTRSGKNVLEICNVWWKCQLTDRQHNGYASTRVTI